MTKTAVHQYWLIIMLIHQIILLLLFCYVTRKQCIINMKYVHVSIAYVCLVTNTFFVLLILLVAYPIIPSNTYCQILVAITRIFFSCSKLSIYYFFLERLFYVDHNLNLYSTQSQNNKGNKYNSIWRLFLFSWAILISTALVISANGSYDSLGDVCVQTRSNWFVSILIVFGDLLICSTISILLARKLLTHTTNNNNKNKISSRSDITDNPETNNNNNYEFNVLTKCVLLSFTAIISTAILIAAASNEGFGDICGTLDSAINIWCIILTFKPFEKIYLIIFGSIHNCV
eukprot:251723_1